MKFEGKIMGILSFNFYEALKNKDYRETTISPETYEELEFIITKIFHEIFDLDFNKANEILRTLFNIYKEINNEKN